MPNLSFKGLLKGGLLVTNLCVLYLSKRNNRIPRMTIPSSCFFTFISLFGIIAISEGESEDDDPDYENRMAEFYRLRPYLMKKLIEQAQLMAEFEREKKRSNEIWDLEHEVADIWRRVEQLQPVWQAMVPDPDSLPLLRSLSFETLIFNYKRPARQESLDFVPRSFSSSEVESSSKKNY